MKERSLNQQARLCGLLYLLLILSGVYCLIYVPSQTGVPGNYAATAQKMLAHEQLFRSGALADVISNVIFIFLGLALYHLLKEVKPRRAKAMLVLLLVQLPLLFITEGLNLGALSVPKSDALPSFDPAQRLDMAMLLIKINESIDLVLEFFWGLWLIPFGQLVYASGFIPRLFGILLLAAALAYIAEAFTALLLPVYSPYLKLPVLLLVALGEISITLWLLLKGVRRSYDLQS